MTIKETDNRRVKTVRLVSLGYIKAFSWFEKYKGKLFEVIQQREGGFDVDMAPCGHPGKLGYLGDEEIEIVEYHE